MASHNDSYWDLSSFLLYGNILLFDYDKSLFFGDHNNHNLNQTYQTINGRQDIQIGKYFLGLILISIYYGSLRNTSVGNKQNLFLIENAYNKTNQLMTAILILYLRKLPF